MLKASKENERMTIRKDGGKKHEYQQAQRDPGMAVHAGDGRECFQNAHGLRAALLTDGKTDGSDAAA